MASSAPLRVRASALLITALLAACQPGPGRETAPRFDAIGPDEAVEMAGTEPFWSARIADGTLTYRTPELPAGQQAPVRRFEGNSGLGFAATLAGQNADIAITAAPCSDGMSDREYPFTATVRLGEATLRGCAWTAARPATGPAAP